MRLSLLTLALALTAPSAVFAEDAPKPVKVRKVCRETPARTGSHRPGKRVCKTEAEWKEFDQADADFNPAVTGKPVSSQNTSD